MTVVELIFGLMVAAVVLGTFVSVAGHLAKRPITFGRTVCSHRDDMPCADAPTFHRQRFSFGDEEFVKIIGGAVVFLFVIVPTVAYLVFG